MKRVTIVLGLLSAHLALSASLSAQVTTDWTPPERSIRRDRKF